jgi:hypothetical protein
MFLYALWWSFCVELDALLLGVVLLFVLKPAVDDMPTNGM